MEKYAEQSILTKLAERNVSTVRRKLKHVRENMSQYTKRTNWTHNSNNKKK